MHLPVIRYIDLVTVTLCFSVHLVLCTVYSIFLADLKFERPFIRNFRSCVEVVAHFCELDLLTMPDVVLPVYNTAIKICEDSTTIRSHMAHFLPDYAVHNVYHS